MLKYLKLIGLVGGLCFLFSLRLNAQKVKNNPLPKVQKIGNVSYEVLSGLAEVISITKVKEAKVSRLGYDEYEVRFRFLPMEGQEVLHVLKEKELLFKLEHHSSSVLVGPAYIKQMNLKVGTRYAMDLFQTRSGGLSVRRYFYQSKAIEQQLYKAYDEVVDSLSLRLSFNAKDSLLIDVTKESLTGAEQRALMDAELKRGLDQENFAKPQFTEAAQKFLQKHKRLLEEYEAAVRVLAQMEEQKYQAALAKEIEEEKAAEALANKIREMKDTNVKKVVNQTEIVRGCYYEVVPGLAEITTIQVATIAKESVLKYNEHQILFKFYPMEGHDLLEELRDSTLEFFLYHRGQKVRVGPAYIDAKSVRVGTRYAMTLYQKRNGQICTDQYTYHSKALDNDLFEAFPPRSIFIRDTVAKKEKENDLTNLEVDSTFREEDKIVELEDEKIDSYQIAQKDLMQAKANKRAWRKMANEAIKVARIKARALKRQQRLQDKKDQKGIQVGRIKRSTKAVDKPYVDKRTARSCLKMICFFSKKDKSKC